MSKIVRVFTEAKSRGTASRSSKSVIDLCTYSKNKLLRHCAVIELLRKDLILRREEKDLSAVALVTGNVKYA